MPRHAWLQTFAWGDLHEMAILMGKLVMHGYKTNHGDALEEDERGIHRRKRQTRRPSHVGYAPKRAEGRRTTNVEMATRMGKGRLTTSWILRHRPTAQEDTDRKCRRNAKQINFC